MMRTALALFVLLVACGGSAQGAPRPHDPDEVSEEWTSGDDTPLESAEK